MTEHPTVLLGEFPKEFLELPGEVLTTVMRHHQKYHSVEAPGRKLAPHFIAVLDRDKDKKGEIRRGHEAVLRARFRDAQFFWEADQRQPLEERVADLGKVRFHNKLGSYSEKVSRVKLLAEWLAENVELECRRADKEKGSGRHADKESSVSLDTERRRADIRTAARAAELCKSDLTTQLVGEFPELQGVVGGLYAEAQGEAAEVACAIYEHYLPLGPGDATPSTPEGAVLSLADKLDTLAGCFAVGDMPTGSRDPFALRRAANGVVRIIHDSSIQISVAESAQKATAIHANLPPSATAKAPAEDLLAFLEERARYHFREALGFAYDEVNAAFAAGWDDLLDLEARLKATHGIRPTENFVPLAAAFKRIRNILEQASAKGRAPGKSVSPELLEDGPERVLWERFRTLQAEVARLREKKRYAEALRSIASLRPDVDLFFDKVLVNAEDPAVRRNRLALLSQMLAEFSTIADFSEIVAE
jgi:glycyl-tRNA synthetase beta chain